MPLLAALPRGALFREEVRLRRLLASLWEGYALCNVPSRSADAAALLRAFREATLYGAIVVAEEGESERESERAANAEAFRAELFRDAFLKRWIPEALRVTSPTDFTKKKTESDGSSSRALDAPLVAASLCECLVGVSRRPALAETCLRATMERTAADCERMVSGSSPGGRVDAPGARRVAAFHAALCDAAERRDAKDKKEKTTLSDGNVSAKRSADTAAAAVRWVERAFARPIAVAAARAMTTTGPTEAGAALLSSLVEKHGASCLVATDDERPVSDGERASATAASLSLPLLDACFENAPSVDVDAKRNATSTSARARTTVASVRARAGDVGRRASARLRVGAVWGRLRAGDCGRRALILHSENEDSDRESDRASASRSGGSWRRAALDAVVVDAATAKDARERLGPGGGAGRRRRHRLGHAGGGGGHRASLASAVAGAPSPQTRHETRRSRGGVGVASSGRRRRRRRTPGSRWSPRSSARGWTRRRGRGARGTTSAAATSRMTAPRPPRPPRPPTRVSPTAPSLRLDPSPIPPTKKSSRAHRRPRRGRASSGRHLARLDPPSPRGRRAEALARVAFVAETSRRLARLDAGLGCGGDERERVAAARRLAGAAASALAAFGADADGAAAAAAAPRWSIGKASLRMRAIPSAASRFSARSRLCSGPGRRSSRRRRRLTRAAGGSRAPPRVFSRPTRSATARLRLAVSRGVAGAFASALVAPLAETRSAGQKQKLGAEEEDPFASAAGALVREAVERGVEYGDVPLEHGGCAGGAPRQRARCARRARHLARARAVFATAIRAAGASGGGTESAANKARTRR